MDFPKKQAQRLMPLYLLEYSEKLFTNHPNPEDPWGGGGSYTSGDGITISSENVISVDNTIAKKSEIPTNYVTLDTEQTITKSKTINAQLNFGDGAHNSILINADYANKPLISLYENTSGGEFSIGVADGTNTSSTGAYFTYEDDKGLREYRLPYQDREGLTTCTLATNLDLPTKTSDLTNDSGFVTDSSISNFAEIVDVTNGFPDETKTAEILANPSKYVMHGTTTINGFAYHIFASYAGKVTTIGYTWMQIIRIPYNGYYVLKPYAFGYDDDNTWKGPYQYLWKISYGDIYNAPTLATVATSGNYNDLTNKPAIPSTATSTSTSTVTPSTIELVFTYEDNTTQTITLMTGATVSTSTTTTLS